jgi:hypothetical protein
MTIRDEILASLLRLFKGSETPWMTDDELQLMLTKGNKAPRKEALYSSIAALKDDGYVEVKSISHSSLERGFIVRLSVQGRNMYVHGKASLVS